MAEDAMSRDELENEMKAQEPPDTEWALARRGRTMTPQERAQWVLRVGALAQQGKTQVTISRQLGISQPTVSRMLSEFWRTVVLPQAEEARAHEVAIVDQMIESWLPAAITGDKDAAAVVDRFLTRRAKLTGSDAPVRVDATVVEETAQERELRQLLEQAERDSKVKESELRGDAHPLA